MSLLLAAALSLFLAQDPPAPPGGFGTVLWANNPVTWSDGYKTLMDVYLPAAVSPPSGWPGVLVVHGGGGSKNVSTVVSAAQNLASAGYACYAYDVRGDGSTPLLNPLWLPMPSGDKTLHDSAESHSMARSFFPGRIDPTRIAVTGFSQGGQHSIEAAAYSGKPIACSVAGCPITQYPMVLAVAPENMSLDWLAKVMPGGVLVSDETISDMGPLNPFLQLVDADDYAGALAWLQTQHSFATLPLLQQSTVPLLEKMAWQDLKMTPNSTTSAFGTLLAGVPRRLFLTTGGHGTPVNEIERTFFFDLRRRWFDRFLKSVTNGVELETTIEVAMQPDPADYLDPASQWRHRSVEAWPPSVPLTSFHLRGTATLTVAPPPAVEPGPVLVHNVAAGYTALDYVAQNAGTNPALLFASIPKVTAAFRTAPLATTQEIFGRPRMVLHLLDTTGIFQVSAELKHVDPSGQEFPIALGTGGTRDAVAGPHVLEYDFGDIAAVVPAGNRILVRLMNLSHHQPPGADRIRIVPYFSNTATLVQIGPMKPSRLELPLRDLETSLLPRIAIESSAAGVSYTMRIDGGAARAGWAYGVLLGASGEAPGFTAPGVPTLPLNIDALTSVGANAANTAFLPAFVGALSASGQASPRVSIPAGMLPELIGTRFTFAGLLVGPAGELESFGPATLVIDP